MPRCDRNVDGRARAHRHRAARYELLVHQGEVSRRERRCRSVVARNDSCSSTRNARIPERRQRRTRDAGTAPRVVRLPHRCAENARIKLLLVVFIAVPRLLIDETAAPPIFTASGRLPAGAVNTASGMPRTIAPTIAGGTARGQRGNMRFSFQECIAATGGRLRRSSTDEKQSHRRPRDAVRGAACVCYRTSVSELRIARCRFGTMDTSTPENGLPPGFRGLAASCERVARASRAFAQSVRAYGTGPIARSMQRQTDYPKMRLIHPRKSRLARASVVNAAERRIAKPARGLHIQ